MAETIYKYTARIKQPQKVANKRLDPNGGTITERELRALKKDAYGASLIEKGMLVIEAAPAPAGDTGEIIPEFDAEG